MEKERGIIIVGDCRSGKLAATQKALKQSSECFVNLNLTIEITQSRLKILNDVLKSAEAIKNSLTYEKPQSKFISRPRNNFRNR